LLLSLLLLQSKICISTLTIVVSLRTWGKYMTGKRILFFCDNEASVQVLISGHTKDAFMQNCLREIIKKIITIYE
jgi:hypothetical protein